MHSEYVIGDALWQTPPEWYSLWSRSLGRAPRFSACGLDAELEAPMAYARGAHAGV